MGYFILCGVVFFLAYLINISCISVFYHRGITHRAFEIRPWFKKLVVRFGPWMTGLDPKPWCCMHRQHHLSSDTPKDPHSPVNVGIWGVLLAQKNGYCDTTHGLINHQPAYTSLVEDLDFPVNWMSYKEMAWLPYAVHGVIGASIGIFFGAWLLGICYFLGLMSHPLQGWMVNALGHAKGYRNFNTPDDSRNNTMVALLVMGEGYQNNHHEKPESPTFADKWWEVDMGFAICKIAEALRLIDLPTRKKSKSRKAA
jgi:stearoyl-CoA desaturase (Delta-9 desaturase)